MSELETCPKCSSKLPPQFSAGRVVCGKCGWTNQSKNVSDRSAEQNSEEVSYFRAIPVETSSQVIDPSKQRLYTGFTSSLKLLQILGYFIAIVFSASQTNEGFNGFVLAIILSGISCFVIYLSTQGLIAIVDLLSRIEQNTR